MKKNYILLLVVLFNLLTNISCEKNDKADEPIIQKPISAFISDKTEIYVGESVSFTDQTLNNPENWSWR